MKRGTIGWLFGAVAGVALSAPTTAGAGTIKILDVGDSGTTNDGTYFVGDPNPTEPSTGTGVFEPFVRIQGTGHGWCGDGLADTCDDHSKQQLGMNTDVKPSDTNFDTKGGSHWTRSLTLGEVGVVEIDGVSYYEFLLDANEEGKAGSYANLIELTDVQIYLGSDDIFANPELSGLGIDGSGYTGTPFDSSDNELFGMYEPAWSLDSVENGDVTVLLSASICDAPGQCGSGHGDMAMYIPTSELVGSPDDYLVFYSEYDKASKPNGGFEEWSTRSMQQPIPEPSGALVFALGMMVTGARLRRR